MKKMTKEWIKDLEFQDLIVTLEPNTAKKIPFIFMNGGTEFVAKKDLYTVKTNLNVTEKENQISFVMLPDCFILDMDFLGDGKKINEKTCRNDFLLQYLNNLRIISYLPEDILKLVKDKRMLALGYAEKETKKIILTYIKDKFRKALDLLEECSSTTDKAEEELTIHQQFKEHLFISSVPLMFDDVDVTKAEKIEDELFLTLDYNTKVVLNGVKIIEEEIDIANTAVKQIELYKKDNRYELHLLIMKRDENLIANYYYATYEFKDMKFQD